MRRTNSKLVNLKQSQKETKDHAVPMEVGKSKYPYGLKLHLEDETPDKLGLKSLPKVGAVMEVSARAVVESVSQEERVKGKTQKRICLQITDMALDPIKSERQAEDVLYEKGEKK